MSRKLKNHFTEEPSCVRPNVEKAKLCGYLRKKRNKVGGWRKLWFVLHDRLLVSYASKEEYDKLASFKDVLNLVPGTEVRPIEGFRFAIETTTQTVYTFHCDDHVAYRVWISTLLDSLAGKSAVTQNWGRLRDFPTKDIPNALHTPGVSRFCGIKTHSFITTTELPHMARFYDAKTVLDNRNLNDSMKDLGIQKSNTPLTVLNTKTQVDSSNYLYDVIRNKPNQKMQSFGRSFHAKYTDSGCLKNDDRVMQSVSHSCSESLKKQMERIHIEGTKDCRHKIRTVQEEYERNKMIVRSTLEEVIVHRIQNEEKLLPNLPKCPNEPVYAVVDLKNKYARRKNRLSKEAAKLGSYESVCQNYDSTEKLEDKLCVYEDGDMCFKVDDKSVVALEKQEIEENIYEPINVDQNASPAASFRKYFSSLKVNPFMRLIRARKSHYTDIKLPPDVAKSRLTTIRRNFGVYRNSIQKRVRKFCSNGYEPKPLLKCNLEEIPGTSKKRATEETIKIAPVISADEDDECIKTSDAGHTES